jgi:hypothetical protein
LNALDLNGRSPAYCALTLPARITNTRQVITATP